MTRMPFVLILATVCTTIAAAPPATPTGAAVSTVDLGCGVATCQTITPTMNTEALVTAGVGLVQAAIWDSEQWVNNGSRVISANSNSASLSQNSRSTIREYRFKWSQIETARGTFAWSAVQDAIDDAWAESPRKMSGIRIIFHNPRLGGTNTIIQAVPQWFINLANARGLCTTVGTSPNYFGKPAVGDEGACGYYYTRFGSCTTGVYDSDSSQCNGIWSPNNNEPDREDGNTLKQRCIALINSFKSNIDTTANLGKIAWIDVNGCNGSWGEGHTDNETVCTSQACTSGSSKYPTFNEANYKAVIDAFWTLSDTIPLLINFQANDTQSALNWNGSFSVTSSDPLDLRMWRYHCAKAAAETGRGQIAGWRSDGIDGRNLANTAWLAGSTAYKVIPGIANIQELRECYKYGPVTGEPSASWDTDEEMWGAARWWADTDSTYSNGTSTTSPATGPFGDSFNAKYANLSSGWTTTKTQNAETGFVAAIDYFRKTVGYKLYPSQVVIPSAVSASQLFNARLTIRNGGQNALHYYVYAPKLRFTPTTGGSTTYVISADLSRLQYNESVTTHVRGMQLTAGSYTVKFCIGPTSGIGSVTPAVPAVSGTCANDADGTSCCNVGTLTVN